MRDQNIAIIQKVFAAFAAGDLQTILDQLATDVDWRLETTATNIPFAGIRRGKDQVMGFFTAIATTQEQQNLQISEFVADGDNVIALGRYSAVVTATGKKIDGPVALVFKVQDGKITQFRDFVDTADVQSAYTH
jgi:uncharacterized protein